MVQLVERKVLNNVTDAEFEEALEQWAPKIWIFTQKYMPFLEQADKYQEAREVLFRCMEGFDPSNKVLFHTYFHTALFNKAISLGVGIRKDGYPFNKALKHNEDPRLVNSLSSTENGSESSDADRADLIMGGEELDLSIEFHAEAIGFEGLETIYMAGLAQRIKIKDTARVYDVDIDDLKKAEETAKIKIKRLQNEGVYVT